MDRWIDVHLIWGKNNWFSWLEISDFTYSETQRERKRERAITWKESPVKSVQFLEACTNVPFIHGQPKGPPVSGIGWPLFRGRPDQRLSQYFPAQRIPLSLCSRIWNGARAAADALSGSSHPRKNVSQLHVLLVTNLEIRLPVITRKQKQCPSLFRWGLF